MYGQSLDETLFLSASVYPLTGGVFEYMVRPDYSLHYPHPHPDSDPDKTTNPQEVNSVSAQPQGKEKEGEIPLTVFRGFSRKRTSARASRPWVSVLTKRVDREGVCQEQKAGTALRWLLAACGSGRPHHLRVTFTPDDENVLLATGRKDGSVENEEEEEEEGVGGSSAGEKRIGAGAGDGASALINTPTPSTPSTQPPHPRLCSIRSLLVSRAPSHIQWLPPPPLPVHTPLSTLPTAQGGQLNARLLSAAPVLALEGVGVGVATLVGPEGKLISSSRGLQDRLIAYSLGRYTHPFNTPSPHTLTTHTLLAHTLSVASIHT